MRSFAEIQNQSRELKSLSRQLDAISMLVSFLCCMNKAKANQIEPSIKNLIHLLFFKRLRRYSKF